MRYSLNDVQKQADKKKFTCISTFSGVGGGCLGIKQAGGKILAVNEFIEEAQRVYSINFPNTPIIGDDIRNLTGEDIMKVAGIKKGELDLLAGSPPCSSFSTVGLREEGWGKEKKYSDKRQRTDDLFFEFSRIVKEIQPRFFIAENVAGLTQGESKNVLGNAQLDMFGKHEETIYHTLANTGYNVRYEILNSKDFGVPQSRARLIIVGVRKDIDFIYRFPKPTTRVYKTLGEAFKNITNTSKELEECDITPYAIYPQSKILKYGEKSQKYFSLIKQDPNKYAGTLTQTAGCLSAASIVHWENRKFTVQEAIEIMGFPQDIYLGDTYANKIERLGRAITPIIYQKAIEQIVF